MQLDLLEKIWRTLHEPRIITAVMVWVYSTAILAGVGRLLGWFWPLLPQTEMSVIESVVLICAGIVGAVSAWIGNWAVERGAVIVLGGMGVIFGVVVFFEYVTAGPDILHPRVGISATLIMGLTFWVALCITRWFRVSLQPFAPGKGPVPLEQTERLVKRLIEETTADHDPTKE